MTWTWHWWIFLVAIIPGYIMIAFARGAQNDSNMQSMGTGADYKTAFEKEPVAIMAGTLIVGVVLAAIATAVAGFMF
jgi:hypothetical protein